MKLFSDVSTPAAVPLCPICDVEAPYLDTVDFTKSCLEQQGVRVPRIGLDVSYHLCDQCGFCFAPEFHSWSFQDFEKHIYNEDYVLIDPEYKTDRPSKFAALIDQNFGEHKAQIRHLDYGGGEGLLSQILQQHGWDSTTYDPFVNRDKNPDELGQFDLITVLEVFEHVPNPVQLIETLKTLCKPTGVIVFSTLLSDGHIRRNEKLSWWYAAPRNGHISLFSGNSLTALISKANLDYVSFSSGLHTAFYTLPHWIGHIIRKNEMA